MQRLFKLLICLGLFTSSPSSAGQAAAYLTSWGLPDNAVEVLAAADVDTFLLAFAKWDEQAQLGYSDGLLKIPVESDSQPTSGYTTWTQLAHSHPDNEFLISFGGQEFESIWDTLSADNAEQIALMIADLLNTSFPVYRTEEDGIRKQIGEVELDGVDFDFEQAKRLSKQQNELLLDLSKRLRNKIGKNKRIVLTAYHVGADPLPCLKETIQQDCSYKQLPRSSHHGEVIPLLNESRGLFDYYNIMAYDAGRDFDYQTAMQNYRREIGDPALLRLGVTINAQWGPGGTFVMPVTENQQRIAWQAESGFGGFFVWALGQNTERRSLESQVRLINDFAKQ